MPIKKLDTEYMLELCYFIGLNSHFQTPSLVVLSTQLIDSLFEHCLEYMYLRSGQTVISNLASLGFVATLIIEFD